MRKRRGTNHRSPSKELWKAWRRAQARTERALQTWYAAPRAQKADAYGTYAAALEREGLLAHALADAVREGASAAA